MGLNEQEEQVKKNWDWLEPESKLVGRLQRVRDKFKEIYKENESKHGPVEHFVPHGPEHSDAVEDKLHELISGGSHSILSQKERFYLLAAAWLHDLGMLRCVAESVYGKERLLTADEIRSLHHKTTELFIVRDWKRLGIEETDREVLGKLCRYHRRIEDLNDIDSDPVVVDDQHLRLKLLAAYLRLADAMDTSPSRAPAEPYIVCLAYGMPKESRLHWIKNRLVLGILPNASDLSIKIQFKSPYPDQLYGIIDRLAACAKLNSIRKLVTNDLRDELAAVCNVIARGGMSYYLDVIEEEPLEVAFDPRMLNDLRDMVLYDDIMVAPSASKLLEIILVTVAAIVGFSLAKGGDPLALDKAERKDFTKIKKEVDDFLNTIEKKVGDERPCHLGLIILIQRCRAEGQKLTENKSLLEFARWINSVYQAHHVSRRKIRQEAQGFILEQLPHIVKKERVNVLLYGYSELVTKAICGLRDAIIIEKFKVDPKEVRGSSAEAEASKRIRVFICEGQPKTQTGYGDRLAYHDGAQYALHLRRHGFTRLGIIPDIIAGTIITRMPIDCIFLGANGVTPKHFTHSAGHLALAELARLREEVNHDARVPIILVISGEKVMKGSEAGHSSQLPHIVEQPYELEGSWFYSFPEFSANRRHIWMCRDRQLLELLHDEGIFFVNPREDQIPIGEVHYIISDAGYRAVTPANSNSVITELFPTQKTKQ